MGYDTSPLNRQGKRTLLKLLLGGIGFAWFSEHIFLSLCAGILILMALVGIVMGIAQWLLKYALMALGVYVIYVLVLRWLHPGKKPSSSEDLLEALPEPKARDAGDAVDTAALDRELELAVLKAQVREENKGPK
jgi:hypothetical protein